MMNEQQALNRAIEICGGPAATAIRLGLKDTAGRKIVTMWQKRGNLPPEWVIKLEIAVRQAINEMERTLAQARQDNVDRHKLKPAMYPLDAAAGPAENRGTARDGL